MHLGGQQDGRHELTHALGWDARAGGWRSRSRRVVIEGHHHDQATHLRQRGLHDAQSTTRLLLVIDHHDTAEEPVIGDECEMARLSLRVEW